MTFCFNILTLLLLLLSSCQKNPSTDRSHLHLNFQEGDIPSLHPHQLVSHMRGHSLGKLLYEGLVRIDNQGNPSLAGAQSVEISSDGKKYTFKLRDHHWSDGSKVTAEDYLRTWRHALARGSDCMRPDLFYLIKNGKAAKTGEVSIEDIGLRSLDSSTLEVTLEYPSPYFLQLLAHPLCAPLKNPQEAPKVFNGPFMVKHWDKGVCLQLEANPHFWNARSVQLQQINISCIDDPMTSLYLFEKGQIDWIGDTLSPLSRESSLKLIDEHQAICRPVDRFYWLYLNTEQTLLKSAKIRRALSLTVERDEIIRHICFGEPMATPMHEAMIPYPQAWMESTDAVDLFKEGLSELGLTQETCPPLVLSYARQKPLVEYLKNRWESLFGITIQLQRNEWNVFRSNLAQGNFEMGGCLDSVIYGDPLELLERFEELGNYNFSRWEHEPFKKILVSIREEMDEEKKIALLIEAEKILVEEAPIIPIYRCLHVFAHPPGLNNYVFDVGGCVDFAYAYFTQRGGAP